MLSGRLKVKIIQFIMQFSFPRYPFSIRILQNRSPQVTNLSSETVNLSARISPELSKRCGHLPRRQKRTGIQLYTMAPPSV